MACDWCKVCGKLVFDWQPHKCPPMWRVRDPDHHHEDDYIEIYAADKETAAANAVERWDSEDATFSEDKTALVASGNNDDWEEYSVAGEVVRDYTARKKEKR